MIQVKTSQQIRIGQFFVSASILGVITSPPIANFFIALTLIWTLSFPMTRSNLLSFFSSEIGVAFLAFVAIIVAAPFYGIARQSEIFSSIWGWRKILMLPLAAIYFSNRSSDRKNFINLFLLACIFFSTISFLSFILFNTNGVILRNYVTQGLVFSIATSISLLKLIDSKNYKNSILYLILVLFFLLNISIISIGRSGYIGLIIMTTLPLILYYKNNPTKKLISIILLLLTLFTVLALTPNSKNRITQAYNEANQGIITPENTSVGLRITFLKSTLNIIRLNPIIGVGTGGFEKAYSDEVKNKAGPAGIVTSDPHNQYLKILAEQGALGLVIFLFLILSFFKLNKLSECTDIIGLSTLCAWCFTSLANSHFSTFNEGQFIWIWIGIFLVNHSYHNVDIKK